MFKVSEHFLFFAAELCLLAPWVYQLCESYPFRLPTLGTSVLAYSLYSSFSVPNFDMRVNSQNLMCFSMCQALIHAHQFLPYEVGLP